MTSLNSRIRILEFILTVTGTPTPRRVEVGVQTGKACILVETLWCARVERSGREGRETLGRPKRKVCLRRRAAAVQEGLASVRLLRPAPVRASQGVQSPAGTG